MGGQPIKSLASGVLKRNLTGAWFFVVLSAPPQYIGRPSDNWPDASVDAGRVTLALLQETPPDAHSTRPAFLMEASASEHGVFIYEQQTDGGTLFYVHITKSLPKNIAVIIIHESQTDVYAVPVYADDCRFPEGKWMKIPK